MVRNQAPPFSIGQFAAAGGVGVETIRFYQRRGLLPRPARGPGVRLYGEAQVHRLRFIRQAQRAGFTLDEIAELLHLDAGEDRARVRALAERRIQALDERIADLERARDTLRRLARDCAAGGQGPCPILASFDG